MDIKCQTCGEKVNFAFSSKETYFRLVPGHPDGLCSCVSRDTNLLHGLDNEKLVKLASEGNTGAMGVLYKFDCPSVDDFENMWVEKAYQSGDISCMNLLLNHYYDLDWAKYLEVAERKIQFHSPEGYSEKSAALEILISPETSRFVLIEGARLGDTECVETIFLDKEHAGLDEPQLAQIAYANLALGKAEAAYFVGEIKFENDDFAESLRWYKLALETAATTAKGKVDDIWWSMSGGEEDWSPDPHFSGCDISKQNMYLQLGLAYYKLKEWANAIEAFDNANSFLPEPLDAGSYYCYRELLYSLNCLGYELTLKDELDSAEHFLMRAASFKSDWAYANLGWLASKRGLLAAAEHWYRLAADANRLSGIKGMIWVCERKNDPEGILYWTQRLNSHDQNGSQIPQSSHPSPRLIKTWQDAEIVATEWMRYFGFKDATPTVGGADGGVDVVSSQAVAQVKMEGVPTGRPVIQMLFGVAAAENKLPFFFSLAGYTKEAVEWSERVGVALFEFDFQGKPTAISNKAREFFKG